LGEVLTAITKSADAPDVEAGFYDARFEGVSKKFIEGGIYGDGDRYIWLFTLLDDDGEVLYDEKTRDPIQVDHMTSLSLNKNSKTKPKALRVMNALMGDAAYTEWVDGESALDTDALIGRIVQVELYLRENGWPSIASILPKRARRASRGAGPLEGTSNAGNLPF